MQTLLFFPIPSDRPFDGKTSAVQKLARARKVLTTYAYARIVAMWDGWYEDRPGLYFVLDGSETSIRSTVDRLASGLYFVHVLQNLR